MDEALRENLSDGSGRRPGQAGYRWHRNGLLTGANLANHNDAAAVSTFAICTWPSFGLLVGWTERYAPHGERSDDPGCRIGGTFAHMPARSIGMRPTMRTTILWTALHAESRAGVRVSAHVPAASANKQNAIVRRGMRRDMVACLWEGVSLIPDEITKAADGEIVITAVMLHAVKILRADGFYKQQIQTA